MGSGALAGSFGQALTFTRATAKTCLTSDATLVTLANNQPAVEPKGLLIEPAATNLCLWSEAIDTNNGAGAPWFHTSVAVTDAQAVAPDGTTTAALAAYGTGSSTIVSQGIAATNATVYTSSIWLRMVSGTGTLYLSATTDGLAFAGRTTCALTTTWRRFSLTWTATSTATWYTQIGIDTDDAGNQVSQPAQNVYLWGSQFETGSTATSYIKTVGTTATRNQDVLSGPTAGLPSSTGRFDLTYVPSDVSARQRVLVTTQAESNFAGVSLEIISTHVLRLLVRDGASTFFGDSAVLAWAAGTSYRIRAEWTPTTVKLWRNDEQVANLVNTVTATGPSQLLVGVRADSAAATAAGGHIHSLEIRK